MTLKTALIATGVWTLCVILILGAGLWYVTTHPIRGVRTEARAAQMGSGLGVLTAIGYGCIWLPYAAKIGKQKRAERENAKKSQKRRRR